ncbi:hypothetical protein B0H13DRAFT_2323387 [Mycena leptocephala]|nr:hypothetical protein B0H13DRAFT_2323387 [Mycena leptocephala]
MSPSIAINASYLTQPIGPSLLASSTPHPLVPRPPIKYPLRTEKHRHEDFRNEITQRLEGSDLHDIDISDDNTFTDVYKRFTAFLIPAAEKDDRISTPKIEKIVARLRFTGGAIRAMRNESGPPMSFGALKPSTTSSPNTTPSRPLT